MQRLHPVHVDHRVQRARWPTPSGSSRSAPTTKRHAAWSPTSRSPGFLNFVYFTQLKTRTPPPTGGNTECGAYRSERSAKGILNECGTIYFGEEDDVKGPMHTERHGRRLQRRRIRAGRARTARCRRNRTAASKQAGAARGASSTTPRPANRAKGPTSKLRRATAASSSTSNTRRRTTNSKGARSSSSKARSTKSKSRRRAAPKKLSNGRKTA